MDEVAAPAQVSKGTLYHFFESKQDLFLAAMIDSYEESLRIHDTARDERAEDPRVRLDQILDGMSKVHAAIATRMTVHYQAWGVVAGDAGGRERLYGFLADFFDERSADISEVIRDGQRRGVFAADADAVVTASSRRFRPILLTTVTTIAGLLPMALGLTGKSVVYGPFATAIVFGLGMASLLTLFVVPTLYLGLEDAKLAFARQWHGADAPAQGPPPVAAG
jgi:AcrR family transcriptional regulator